MCPRVLGDQRGIIVNFLLMSFFLFILSVLSAFYIPFYVGIRTEGKIQDHIQEKVGGRKNGTNLAYVVEAPDDVVIVDLGVVRDRLAGKILELRPEVIDGRIMWKCRQGGLDADERYNFLPKGCRKDIYWHYYNPIKSMKFIFATIAYVVSILIILPIILLALGDIKSSRSNAGSAKS